MNVYAVRHNSRLTTRLVTLVTMAATTIAILSVGCERGTSIQDVARQTTNVAPTPERIVPTAREVETPPGILPFFQEVGQSVGLRFTRNDDIRGQHRIMEANGGGIANFDYDGDGWPDVFLTNGCRLPLRERSRSDANALFRNRGSDGFSDVTLFAGLRGSGYWQGCTTGDFDGDGFDDLYVAAYGDNAFYRNQGDGTFQDITAETGTAVGLWSSSPAFADLNGDGNLDLFVVTYVEASDDPPKLCPEPASRDGYIQCSPTLFRASEDVLFLGDGNGGFINVTRSAGASGVDGKGLGIAIFDADGDDLPEIFIANDGTPNFLYCRDNTSALGEQQDIVVPRFIDRAFEQGVAVSGQGKAQAGMGVAIADVDGDGWQDIFVTNFYGEPNSLYRNSGVGGFEDVSASSGLGPASRPFLGFGAEFLDADNDGWPDLFVTNGHVDDLSSFTKVPYRMPPLIFRSEHNGKYLNVTRWAGAYCQQNWLGRGLATTDLDRDGKIDVIISCQLGPSAILHNETPQSGSSCRLRLIGVGASNRSAFHARVQVEGIEGTPIRQVIGGGSFQSASDRTIHIGMGSSTIIPSITIRWPDGTLEVHRSMTPGSFVMIQGRGPVPLNP